MKRNEKKIERFCVCETACWIKLNIRKWRKEKNWSSRRRRWRRKKISSFCHCCFSSAIWFVHKCILHCIERERVCAISPAHTCLLFIQLTEKKCLLKIRPTMKTKDCVRRLSSSVYGSHRWNLSKLKEKKHRWL